jgi:DNA-directed RNA polymerase subunit RPC12/RpoP
MAVMGRTYTCAQCGKTFVSEWSDEDAQAEAAANFSSEELADTAVVCDACYELLMAWHRRG